MFIKIRELAGKSLIFLGISLILLTISLSFLFFILFVLFLGFIVYGYNSRNFWLRITSYALLIILAFIILSFIFTGAIGILFFGGLLASTENLLNEIIKWAEFTQKYPVKSFIVGIAFIISGFIALKWYEVRRRLRKLKWSIKSKFKKS